MPGNNKKSTRFDWFFCHPCRAIMGFPAGKFPQGVLCSQDTDGVPHGNAKGPYNGPYVAMGEMFNMDEEKGPIPV